MINFKYKAIAMLIMLLIIVGASLYHSVTVNKLETEVQKWKNKTTNYQEVVQEKETIYSKKVKQVKKIETENEELKKLLEKRDEIIIQQTHIVAELRDSVKNAHTTPDTIYSEEKGKSFPIRRFYIERDFITVKGFFETNPPFDITFDTLAADIGMLIVVGDTKDSLKVYVDFPYNNITAKYVDMVYIPYEPSFWDEFHIGFSVLASKNFLFGGTELKYKQISILAGLSNHGFTAGWNYWIK